MGLSWGDLNPASWPGQVKRRFQKDFGFLTEESESAKQQREGLQQQAGHADGFRQFTTDEYGGLTTEMAGARDMLRRQAMGQDSLSAEQLRQGLQQNLSAQRSMAASASPANSAMAARTAAINMGRQGMGMSGQAAMAGIAERRSAQDALANMLLGQRGQSLQGSLGSSQNAISALGGGKPEASTLEKLGPAISAGATLAAMSDERNKTQIANGDGAANRAASTLSAHTFRYRDPAHGEGKQVGIMAQDLERAGLGHAVMNTPAGKMVHGPKLEAANTAMIASLAKRLGKLEGGK